MPEKNTNKIIVTLVLLMIFVAGALGGFFIYKILSPIFLSEKNDTSIECSALTHTSLSYSKDDIEEAYAKAKTYTPKNTDIKGVLVNKHMLAKSLIAETLGALSTSSPQNIVLIIPNNTENTDGKIVSSMQGWQTPYGTLATDCGFVQELENAGLLKTDEYFFEKDTSASSLVPFIKKSLPNAKVTVLAVSPDISANDIENISKKISEHLSGDALVIGAFDFSRTLPDTGAQFHDEKSLAVIKNFDYDGLQVLDVESKTALSLFLRTMQKTHAQKLEPVEHTNSAQALSYESLDETTSYINALFSLGRKDTSKSATILAFGDMMLDRAIRKKINENSFEYPFIPLKNFLIGSDVVVANAEGPFTSNISQTIDRVDAPLTFTFDPNILPTIKSLGFTLLSQANNHTLNFGEIGFSESKMQISNASLAWFGDPKNEDVSPYETNIRGRRIAFVGYHEFTKGGLQNVLDTIAEEKSAGAYVVVYPHWGVEYSPVASAKQKSLAHSFIDQGADLILGAHPHVVEPLEIYKNKMIFYSMGNFVFDQAPDGPKAEGLAVGISINENQVKYFIFPLNIRHGQASLMLSYDRVRLLNDLSEKSEVESEIKSEIQSGVVTLSI